MHSHRHFSACVTLSSDSANKHISCCKNCQVTKNKQWLLDSGATHHYTNDQKDFIDYKEFEQLIEVNTAEKEMPIFIKGCGTILIRTYDRDQCTLTCLHPVYYIPNLDKKLLSQGELLKCNYKLSGDKDCVWFTKSSTTLSCYKQCSNSTLYWLKTDIVK